ncbi:hypothetical protein HNV11_02655 [Spirosoma taeanense]|uniref:DUF4276 family protein n=1 Tax=Spirosoma taeanense TaxID=2735870 RepID=A0A6M5Y6M4_9BACT|nr:hypothetical protein [Spirosoma taeanense]QJW88352.1 hypothetical protein HNV11_02655 [Spirosoma taeanense]
MKHENRLEYTLIAEGYAEYAFIPTYLKLISSQYGVKAIRSRIGFKGGDAGKSKVLKEAADFCSLAIQQNHQLIIVGVDLDVADHEPEQAKHAAECKIILNALGENYKKYGQQIVHFVPVQAIEHWLSYQAYKTGVASRFAVNGVEGKPQDELKRLLYKGNNSGPNMDRIAQAIAERADFDELAKQSRSFAHFHKQVTGFLNQYNKTQPS